MPEEVTNQDDIYTVKASIAAARFSAGKTDTATYFRQGVGTTIVTRDVNTDPEHPVFFISHTCGVCSEFSEKDNVRLKLIASGFTLAAIKQTLMLLEMISNHDGCQK